MKNILVILFASFLSTAFAEVPDFTLIGEGGVKYKVNKKSHYSRKYFHGKFGAGSKKNTFILPNSRQIRAGCFLETDYLPYFLMSAGEVIISPNMKLNLDRKVKSSDYPILGSLVEFEVEFFDENKTYIDFYFGALTAGIIPQKATYNQAKDEYHVKGSRTIVPGDTRIPAALIASVPEQTTFIKARVCFAREGVHFDLKGLDITLFPFEN